MKTLTRADLKRISGRKQRRTVEAWLAEKRWPFELDADGWPVVSQAYAEKKLGVPVTAGASGEEAPPPTQPNFESLSARA